MSKRIRPFPIQEWHDRRVTPHLRDIRLKVLCDIDAYIRLREYGKASELLQTIVCTGAIQVKDIWKPLIAIIRQQGDHRALGSFLDIIISETRTHPPYAPSMERFFVALDTSYDDAYAVMLAFSTDTGSKLGMAHGFLGIIIACLRELELRRINASYRVADQHVFKHSEFAQFVLTVIEDSQRTKYSLANAERHLERALELDPACDFFVPFHAQVLVALGRVGQATAMLERQYEQDKSIHVLRMLMSLDSRKVIDQTRYMLDYLELDPFASANKYFDGFISQCLARANKGKLSAEILSRVFLIIVDRIERGDADEADKWKYLALFIKYLRQDYPDIVRSAMDQRLEWWSTMYFGWSSFHRVNVTDRIVFMAVCAQQLLDLEHGHPVYAILSGDLTNYQATFVNDNMRIVESE